MYVCMYVYMYVWVSSKVCIYHMRMYAQEDPRKLLDDGKDDTLEVLAGWFDEPNTLFVAQHLEPFLSKVRRENDNKVVLKGYDNAL